MKKIIRLSSLMLAFLLLFVGCGGSKEANRKEDKDLREKAEYAIKLLSDGDYDKFCEELPEESKKSTFTIDAVKEKVEKVLSDAGDFDKFTSDVQATNKDKDGKKTYNAIMTGKYDNKSVLYIISFNKDLKLVDFSIKEKEKMK